MLPSRSCWHPCRMTKGTIIRLVIDASVARSAGSVNALDTLSITCRHLLIAIRSRHRVLVMAPEISKEWRKHASRFAIEWWSSMVAARKVDYIRLDEWADLWAEIESCISEKGIVSKGQLPGMRKDFHLVRAALQTDKTIISTDNKARRPYSRACARVEQLRDIIWWDAKSDKVAEWIQGGALLATARHLHDAVE